MKKKIKLIIFDLDGTLVNAYPAVASSINFTMRQLGLPQKDRDFIRRSVGWGDSQLIKGFVGEELYSKAIAIYRKHHLCALKAGTRYLPGAKKVLEKLKVQKYKLAVATNRPARFTNIILRDLNMRKYFHYVLCADKLKKGKPDPEILNKILKKFSLTPGEALYVGDMAIDVQAGGRAKIKAVAVSTGSTSLSALRKMKPYKVIDRMDRLLTVVRELNF